MLWQKDTVGKSGYHVSQLTTNLCYKQSRTQQYQCRRTLLCRKKKTVITWNMFAELHDLWALRVYKSRSIYCYFIEYLKGSARFRNVLLKDFIQRHSFDLTMLLAQSSLGPITLCEPTDISFAKFREIQSNGLKVERTHTNSTLVSKT